MLKDALSPAGKNEGHAKAVMIFAFIEQLLRAPHSLTECSSLRIHLRLAGVRPGLPASLCIRCNGSETRQGRPLGRPPLWPSCRHPSAFRDAPAPPPPQQPGEKKGDLAGPRLASLPGKFLDGANSIPGPCRLPGFYSPKGEMGVGSNRHPGPGVERKECRGNNRRRAGNATRGFHVQRRLGSAHSTSQGEIFTLWTWCYTHIGRTKRGRERLPAIASLFSLFKL